MDQEEIDKETVKDAWFKCFVSQTEEKVNDQEDIFREEYTITNRRVCLWCTTITNICKEDVGRIIMGSLRLGDSMMIPYIAFHDNMTMTKGRK